MDLSVYEYGIGNEKYVSAQWYDLGGSSTRTGRKLSSNIPRNNTNKGIVCSRRFVFSSVIHQSIEFFLLILNPKSLPTNYRVRESYRRSKVQLMYNTLDNYSAITNHFLINNTNSHPFSTCCNSTEFRHSTPMCYWLVNVEVPVTHSARPFLK